MSRGTKNPDAITMNDYKNAVSKRDTAFYDNLSDAGKKYFRDNGTYMVNRYISDPKTTDPIKYMTTVMAVNMYANQYNLSEFNLKDHPELRWQLLARCNVDGNYMAFNYIRPPANPKRNKVFTWVAEQFPLLKNDEIELLLAMNTTDDLKQLAKDSGLDDNEIKEIFGK